MTEAAVLISADATFHVVAAGSGQERVEAAAFRSAVKRAFQRDLLNSIQLLTCGLWP